MNYIGQKSQATNGQMMEIIKYVKSSNIDVKFEDGTIVRNKTYGAFKNGNIKNPNVGDIRKNKNKINRVGMKRTATNGQLMTIINYEGVHNIDVQFEDGTIVTGKNYINFIRGTISNPNCKIIGASIGEYAMLFYLKEYGYHKYKAGTLKNIGFGNFELDCYNEYEKIAIEYDGPLHSRRYDKDYEKNKICQKNGIKIIRFRDTSLKPLPNSYKEYVIPANGLSIEYENKLKECLSALNIKIDINFTRDRDAIYRLYNTEYKNYLGKENISKCNEKMKVIAYRGYDDIDIEFEDGTVVYNRSYKEFKNGNVENPNNPSRNNYKNDTYEKWIGVSKITRRNQKMTIIGYRSPQDIDIEFEDGTIVKNKTVNLFCANQIRNPNYKPHIGEIIKSNNGQYMKIIEWKNKDNIDVEFEDNTIVYSKSYSSFKKGKIANPNYNKYIGQVSMANNGQKMKIIEYRNSHDIDVEFEDGIIVESRSMNCFNRGTIRNPNFINHHKRKIVNNKEKYIGKIGYSSKGQMFRIIDYKGCENVDIEFEDGNIIRNRRIVALKKGLVANSEKEKRSDRVIENNSKKYIGKKGVATNGEKMEIINYRKYKDIDVRFEDGTIVKHKTVGSFKNGYISKK